MTTDYICVKKKSARRLGKVLTPVDRRAHYGILKCIHPSIHTYIIHTNIHINTSTTISRWLNYRDSRMTLKIFYDVPALTRDGQPIWIHPSVARYTPVRPGSAAECSYDSLHTIKSSVKKWGRQWSRWCFSSLCRSPKHLQASICTAKRMAPRWNTLNRLCPIAL